MAQSLISFRPAEVTDLPGILELYRVCLDDGTVPMSRRFWQWKHGDNPFGPSPCLVATAENRLVGLRVFMRWRWQVGEQRVRSLRAVDTATHPSWRGHGVFSELTRRLVAAENGQGAAFVYNTPNRRSRPGYLRLGWRDVGRIPLLVRRLRAARAVVAGLGLSSAATAPDLQRFPPVAELLSRRMVAELGNDEADSSRRPRLRTDRSPAYLQWRYSDIPGFDYRALWRQAGDCRCWAAVIFRGRTRRRLSEIAVCEILRGADERSADLAAALLEELARRGEAHYLVAASGPGSPTRAILRQAGFRALPQVGPRLTVLPLDAATELPDPTLAHSWDPSIGDFEIL